MAQQKFGGLHTEQKLAALESYLHAYMKALKNQPFSLAFFDAFAGTGRIELQGQDAPLLYGLDAEQFIDGSAQRALRCDPKFNEYILVEKSRTKARDLDKLKLEHPEIASRIHIKRGDANDELKAFCDGRDWKKWRAVVFLDPFGNQVPWTTIETIAATKGIDLWYLFPAGPGVHRQIVSFEPLIAPVGKVNLKGVHWAIVGGESGPRARPMDPAWVDEIERQCRRDGTAFFFKQWGGKNKKAAGRTYRGQVWNEYPVAESQHETV